ncbi:PREDICTED: uncharacterized protein LOC107337430 isoform X3 [Acropora digitifera]|uniref:uncharacterized protein LOC107337430 isoform X3 n=1 Tax=Acropora digitifera TaxID=70779 RepID=UPI00077AD299|nr:PREDICTED: uncharacterized protein LOC107337430 isoform X3 [Acropora digitifera]
MEVNLSMNTKETKLTMGKRDHPTHDGEGTTVVPFGHGTKRQLSMEVNIPMNTKETKLTMVKRGHPTHDGKRNHGRSLWPWNRTKRQLSKEVNLKTILKGIRSLRV